MALHTSIKYPLHEILVYIINIEANMVELFIRTFYKGDIMGLVEVNKKVAMSSSWSTVVILSLCLKLRASTKNLVAVFKSSPVNKQWSIRWGAIPIFFNGHGCGLRVPTAVPGSSISWYSSQCWPVGKIKCTASPSANLVWFEIRVVVQPNRSTCFSK